MKRILLLSILSLLALSITAQQPARIKSMSTSQMKLLQLNNINPLSRSGILGTSQLKFTITPKINKSELLASATKRLDNSLTENWNSVTLWSNSQKTEYVYGTGSEVSTHSFWQSLPAPAQWVADSKKESTLDVNGNVTLELDYTTSAGSGIWDNYSRDENTYDGNGDIILHIFYLWNQTFSKFIEQTKSEYTYDGSRNLTSDIEYKYVTSDWVNSARTDYTYSGGKKTEEISFKWDLTLAPPAWVDSIKTNYTYDVTGKKTLETTQIWDKNLVPPDWINDSQIEYGYDGAGNLNLMTSYAFDIVWIPMGKLEFVYDANGNVTQTTISGMIGTNWVGQSKDETTYSANQKITVTSQGDGSGGWILSSRTTDNYSDVTRIEKPPVSNIRVYPNPASDYIIFDFADPSGTAKAQVYDLSGRKVMEISQSVSRQVIPANNFSKGMYVYKIQSDGRIITGRLIIK